MSVKLRISVTCISFVYVVIFDFTDPVIYNYNMNSNIFFIRKGLGFYVIFKIATGLKNEDDIDKENDILINLRSKIETRLGTSDHKPNP